MNDARLFLLFPLLLFGDQAISELILTLTLLWTVGQDEARLATRDIVLKNIRCDVSLLLRFAKTAKLGQELGLFLAARSGDRSGAEGAAEVCHRFGCSFGLW